VARVFEELSRPPRNSEQQQPIGQNTLVFLRT